LSAEFGTVRAAKRRTVHTALCGAHCSAFFCPEYPANESSFCAAHECTFDAADLCPHDAAIWCAVSAALLAPKCAAKFSTEQLPVRAAHFRTNVRPHVAAHRVTECAAERMPQRSANLCAQLPAIF
jgi:hypothetical protein